jgi:hypothetical protein
MPFPSYRALANDDVKAIITYLRGVPPVRNAVAKKAQYDFALPDSWGPPVGHIEAPRTTIKSPMVPISPVRLPVARCATLSGTMPSTGSVRAPPPHTDRGYIYSAI